MAREYFKINLIYIHYLHLLIFCGQLSMLIELHLMDMKLEMYPQSQM